MARMMRSKDSVGGRESWVEYTEFAGLAESMEIALPFVFLNSPMAAFT